MDSKNFNILNLLTAFLESVVKNKDLDSSLKKYGLSEEYLLGQMSALHDKPLPNDYLIQMFSRQFGTFPRPSDTNLYFIKKVFCSQENLEVISTALFSKAHGKISKTTELDNQPFISILTVGTDRTNLGYKDFSEGIEAYLIGSKNKESALDLSFLVKPVFYFAPLNFTKEEALKYDSLITSAVVNPCIETVSAYVKEIDGPYSELTNLVKKGLHLFGI